MPLTTSGSADLGRVAAVVAGAVSTTGAGAKSRRPNQTTAASRIRPATHFTRSPRRDGRGGSEGCIRSIAGRAGCGALTPSRRSSVPSALARSIGKAPVIASFWPCIRPSVPAASRPLSAASLPSVPSTIAAARPRSLPAAALGKPAWPASAADSGRAAPAPSSGARASHPVEAATAGSFARRSLSPPARDSAVPNAVAASGLRQAPRMPAMIAETAAPRPFCT